MPVKSTRPILILTTALAWSCVGTNVAFAEYTIDPMAHWRAQIEDARRKSVPAPPRGVREMHWNSLSPAGWNPGQILQRLGVRDLSDGDPAAKQVEAEIQREWDQAPTVPLTQDTPVRMTGYPILLSDGDGLVRTILLVPYRGACIHRPSPPANQMVMVTFKSGIPRNMDTTAIWVTGKIYPLAAPTQYGRVAYTMLEAQWQKYPIEKYPLPQYIPLR